MKIYGVVGWRNAGKTTLVERLVREIVGRGYTVSTVKHAHHAFDVDHEGKDSWRHRMAGASQVMIGSKHRWALMSELRGAPEPPLDQLIARLDPVDLLLIEGFKGARGRKIEIFQAGAPDASSLAENDPDIRARVSQLTTPPEGERLPHFHRDAIAEIADFVIKDSGLAP